MNKTAIVTGGNRNIGREAALALASKSVDLIITYNERKEQATETVNELAVLGIKATAIQINFETTSGIKLFVKKVKATLTEWGKTGLDILINNAGTLKIAPFDKVTEADLDTLYQTNYKSIFFLTQELLPHLNDGGRIVNLGSGTAKIAFGPLISYGPMKAALQSLTVYLASFLGSKRITVNAVAPGGLDDDFNAPLFNVIFPPAREYIKSNTAVGRLGMPKDIGHVIAFLCSEEASFISGAVIPIDGGYHL
ncbi:MAG TPA: SDR family oxidoreductase [Chitinophagaceae bacterium]|nr:SDR family oxidoreductase [Chitinophagaceae bacterium]